MLQMLGLTERRGHLPNELSGGQQQRTSIGRAMITRPSLVLADEPTGNLDEKTGAEIMNLFHELHDAGTTIVMVTHNPYYEPHYDRVIYLRNGTVWKIIDNIAGTTQEFQ